ncbi:hypothetical protein [Wolinella succinogenes]|nr:hypothetical protein [Wolinella succinogenes]VEG80275.1 Uncharacterised protein [Wolinella succinogenes]HCZ17966.1 hypothetical protein [Helicobacter sp.]
MGIAGWSCSYMTGDRCERRSFKPCSPGEKGCILYGKATFTPQETPVEDRLKRSFREAPKNAFASKKRGI